MAKKRRGRPPGSVNKPKTVVAAETIGSALGAVMAKVDTWLAQRQEIARELREVADKVMAGENPFAQRVTTPSMLAKEVAQINAPEGTRRRRRKMSAAAREKIAAAQRARWAKQKRAAK